MQGTSGDWPLCEAGRREDTPRTRHETPSVWTSGREARRRRPPEGSPRPHGHRAGAPARRWEDRASPVVPREAGGEHASHGSSEPV